MAAPPSPPPPSLLSLPRSPPRTADVWPSSRPSDYAVPLGEPLSPRGRGPPKHGSRHDDSSESWDAGRSEADSGSASWDARHGDVERGGDGGGKRGCGAWLYGLLGVVAGFMLSFFAFLFLCRCCACCGPMFGGEPEQRTNRRAFAIGAAVGMVLSVIASFVYWRYAVASCYGAGGRVFCY